MRISPFVPDSLGGDDLAARMVHMLKALEHERDLVIEQGIDEANHWADRFGDMAERIRKAPDQTWNSLGEFQGNPERMDLWLVRLSELNETIKYLRTNLIECGVIKETQSRKRQVAARKVKKTK